MEAGTAAVQPNGVLRRIGSRIGWNICDQALSSLTNAALSVLVARSVTQESFGAFALCFTIYTLVIALSRGFISEPLTIRYGAASAGAFAPARAAAAGSSLLVGVAFGIALLALAPTQEESLAAPLAALAICLPGLLVQDALRLSFITEGNPRRAAANDFVWAVVQLGAVALLLQSDTSGAAPYVLAWGGAAIAAAAYGFTQARTLPAVATAFRWMREQLHLSRLLAAEYVTVQGGFQVALLLVAAIAGVEAVGAIRGAAVVLGPINILLFAAYAFAVPELVRRRHLPLLRHVRLALVGSATLVAAVAAWATMVLMIPSSLGVELLGDTWRDARSVLLPMALSTAGIAATLGPICALKAYGAARDTLGLGALVAALLISLGTIGVALDGAHGAAIGFAVTQWLVVPLVWYRMVVVVRRAHAEEAR